MNLRVIQSSIKPFYKAKNDIMEFMADYDFTPALKLTWQTGYNHDFLASDRGFQSFRFKSAFVFQFARRTQSRCIRYWSFRHILSHPADFSAIPS